MSSYNIDLYIYEYIIFTISNYKMINKKKYNWKELHNELENDIMYLIKKHSKFYRKSIIKSRFDTIIHKDKKSILRDLIGNV